MKKIIFILSCAATVAILILFFSCISKFTAYDGFMRARSKISGATGLACALEDTLGGLKADANTAIIKIPSVNLDGTIMPENFDHCAITISGHILMFSMIPSPATGRKHRTIYYRDFPECALNSSGNVLEFTCSIGGVNFQQFSSVLPDFLPVPEKGTDIFK